MLLIIYTIFRNQKANLTKKLQLKFTNYFCFLSAVRLILLGNFLTAELLLTFLLQTEVVMIGEIL